MLCWLAVYFTLTVLFFTSGKGAAATAAGCAGLATAFGIVLLRHGRLRAAGGVCLLGIWFLATVILLQSQSTYGVALLYYVALPVTGAWLFGFKVALAIAGFCAGGGLMMPHWHQSTIPLPLAFPDTSLDAWMIATAMILSTAPVVRVLQILKEALAMGRSAQAALREAHGQLQELLRRSSLELAEARETAQTARRAKIALLASMNRELRTPLSAILGLSTLVRSGPGLTEGQRKDLEAVGRSGEQVLDFIKDALDLSMIEEGFGAGDPADAAVGPMERALEPERVRAASGKTKSPAWRRRSTSNAS